MNIRHRKLRIIKYFKMNHMHESLSSETVALKVLKLL